MDLGLNLGLGSGGGRRFPIFGASPVEGNLTTTLTLSLPADKVVTINWGDGNSSTVTGPVTSTDYAHEYTAGSYSISMTGDVTSLTEFTCNDATFRSYLRSFKTLTSLTVLDIGSTGVSGPLVYLRDLLSLVTLDINDTSITGDASEFAIFGDLTYLDFSSTAVESYTTTTLPLWPNIVIAGQDNGWSQASVDAFLCDLAAGGGTGGSVDLSGTNEAPSLDGLICKDLLVENMGRTITATEDNLYNVALLWNASDALVSAIGPDASFASAGDTPDGNGGVLAANVPAIHTVDGRELMWNGPGYSNTMVAGEEDISTWRTDSSATIVVDKIIPTASSGAHYIYGAAYAHTSGVIYHSSIELKADGYNWVRLSFNSSAFPTSERVAYFDLANGVKGTVDANVNATITALADGWFRCSISRAATITYSTAPLTVAVANADGSIIFTGDGVSGVRARNPMSIVGSYQMPYIPPGTTVTSCAGSTGLNGLTWPMSGSDAADRLKDCFQGPGGVAPAIMTAAALVRMGVGSGELLGDSTARNIVSPTTATTFLYYRGHATTESSSSIISSYDGTTYTGPIGTWNRNEYHLKIVQTNATGTQFRVGNQRYTEDMVPIGSAVVWGTWAAFDGSFNPLDTLIAALNTTVPHWTAQVQVWDSSASESLIKQLMIEYYPESEA